MSDRDAVYDRFNLLVNAPALFNAVATAAELGIFLFLSENPGACAEKIQEHTHLPRHQLRVLLQAVCSTGLVQRADGGYRNSAAAQDLLGSDTDDSWAHILIGWREIYYPAFAEMTTALRAGTNTALSRYPGDEPTLYQRLARDPEREAVFHRAMTAFTLRSVDALADREEFDAVDHLLDVGGGDGATSRRLVAAHPHLRATVFDMPTVTRLGEVRRAPGADGITFLAGDMLNGELPPGADGVLFSHVLEIFDEGTIVDLMRKAYRALPPGGRVFVYGYNVSDDETSGIFGARLGLYFNVLASGRGMAYPAHAYEEWLRQAGFDRPVTVTGMPYEHGLSMATKC